MENTNEVITTEQPKPIQILIDPKQILELARIIKALPQKNDQLDKVSMTISGDQINIVYTDGHMMHNSESKTLSNYPKYQELYAFEKERLFSFEAQTMKDALKSFDKKESIKFSWTKENQLMLSSEDRSKNVSIPISEVEQEGSVFFPVKYLKTFIESVLFSRLPRFVELHRSKVENPDENTPYYFSSGKTLNTVIMPMS